MPEALFTVPTDGAIFTDIAATKNGRIFLSSRDGCLYEVEYQVICLTWVILTLSHIFVAFQDKGWFRRNCRKVNHSKGFISYLVPSFVSQSFGDYGNARLAKFVLFVENKSNLEALTQVVIDESRNILYTRSESGSIQIFDLGSDGNQLSKVANLNVQNIFHTASQWAQ